MTLKDSIDKLLVCTFFIFCSDFAEVSRVLTFDSERTTNFVNIEIFDDVEREIALETVNLQLSFVEEERSSSLLLLPSQATINIQDDDG